MTNWCEFLVDLSGTDPKVLENKEFVDMMLPALRGYYRRHRRLRVRGRCDGVVPHLCVRRHR